MSEHSRYEKTDQQFNDLPMPDEETSWQKMKEMLDDDDTIVPPPVFLKSCLGWGILLTGLIAAWLIVHPEKWWSETGTEQVSSSDKTQKQPIERNREEQPITHQQQKNNKESLPGNIIPSDQTNENPSTSSRQKEKLNPPISEAALQTRRKDLTNKNFANNFRQIHKSNQAPVVTKIQKSPLRKENSVKKQFPEITSKGKTQKAAPVTPVITQPSDNPANDGVTSQGSNFKKTDTLLTTTNQQAPVTTDTVTRTDSANLKKAKQKKLLIAAGLGEQFLIPIAGQTTVPYSRYGRKSSLADYVPSFFILLQKERKWFVQTEFRYGAAQSVKEFSYNQNTKYDAISSNITTTTMRLKKTYYHQLPASFNYFIKPNVSIGVGGMYSHFYGAVTEKEITTLNTQTQSTSTSKEIIPVKHFTDSFLYKTQVHALLQADYHWKKFSFGLRYTKDIQPYIRYTRPDGTVDEEKNQSLQLIVRYRFWQSRKL